MIDQALPIRGSGKTLRVVFYFFSLDQSSGGAERIMLRLANEMSLRGHDVHIVSWDAAEAQVFYPVSQAISWHRLGFAPGWRDKMRRTYQLSRLLRRIRCQVFIGFVMGADKTVYAANLMANVPIIAAERNSPEMYSLKLGTMAKAFYMGLFLLARRIVVQNPEYRDGYPQWLRRRISTIPNPVDAARVLAHPLLQSGSTWVLLCVARLEEQKNLEVLVRAFAMLAPDYPDWNLRIVGEGSLRPALEAQVSGLALDGRVSLPGALSQVSDEYAKAHLFCLPSRWEGFPNALAEAMAHGLPVVGFKECPGVNSMIDHGVDGLLAPGNGDAAALSAALGKLMAEPEQRASMGAAAALVAQRYSPERIMNEWETLLREVSNHG